MAPSAFFPPLDQCLSGDIRLLSFKTAYRALTTDCKHATSISALEDFLTDSETQALLYSCLDPFQPPSAKTKADFETKTAPIHVSQSSNGEYDLEQIKADALWVSEKLKLDENVALRVVMLEWQARAEDLLLRSEESRTSDGVQTGMGSSFLGSSTRQLGVSTLGPPAPSLDFSNKDIRRERQLQIYLEEKSFILRVSTELVNGFSVHDPEMKTGRNWIDDLAKRVTENLCYTTDAAAHQDLCSKCVTAVEGAVDKLSSEAAIPEAFREDEAKRLLHASAAFQDILTTLRLLLASLYTLQGIPGASLISSWFKLMDRMGFFQNLSPELAWPDPSPLQYLISLVSLTMLKLPEALAHLRRKAESTLGGASYPSLPDQSYLEDDDCVKEVHRILCQAALNNVAIASLSIYAWSLLGTLIRNVAAEMQELREQQRMDEGGSDDEPYGRRRSSRRDSRDDASTFEKQAFLLKDSASILEPEARDDPSAFLAQSAVDRMNVYGLIPQLSTALSKLYGSKSDMPTSFISRGMLLELVKEGMDLVSYGPEVLEAILTILEPSIASRSKYLDGLLARHFWCDTEILRPVILDQSLARYPYELSPMLRLFTSLAAASTAHFSVAADLVQMLESLTSMTVIVPEDFRDYELDHEDENANNMHLTSPIPLVVSRQSRAYFGAKAASLRALTMGTGEDNGVLIPSKTNGIILKETRPFVFRLDFPHSGLEYLGLLLCTFLHNSEVVAAQMDAELDHATATEIVTLITSLLEASLKQAQGVEEGVHILERFSHELPNELDVVSVIAEIMEVELLSQLDQPPQDESHELLIACADFFTALISIRPDRVWSILHRSTLLGNQGGVSALFTALGGCEVATRRFQLLAAFAGVYAELVDDAVAGLVKRKTQVNRVTNRFDSPLAEQDAISDRTMGAVLEAWQEVMVDAWRNLGEWQFLTIAEDYDAVKLVLKGFGTLVKSAYGVDAGNEAKKRVSGVLLSSAAALLDAFAPRSGDAGTMTIFAGLFAAGLQVLDDTISVQKRTALLDQTSAALDLATLLVRVAKMLDEGSTTTGQIMDQASGGSAKIIRAANLGIQLFKSVPVLAKLMVADHSLKGPICTLLSEIVPAVNDITTADPPSLLGQLPHETAKSFLAVTTQLDRPLRDLGVERSIWAFLSAVMGSRQQWFALFLLTGTLPKRRLDPPNVKRKSLLTSALDELSNIAMLPPERAIAMLKFVASAQGMWVWAANEVRSHADFLKNALEWLSDLQVPARSSNTAEELIVANEHQMAASLCDILAVNVHAGLEVGDKEVVKLLVPKISFLTEHGSAVNAYNRSLHERLGSNFGNRVPGAAVADFKRTAANPAPFGRDFAYDLDLAGSVLRHETSWHRVANGRPQGFAEEFARANVNLSLLEAQTRLLKSWNFLATTLCECVETDEALQSGLAKTAERCLSANAAANLDEPGMEGTVRTRADMAFVIMAKLVGVQSRDAGMKALLPAAWELVRTSPVNYDLASLPEDLRYYRTLLQILYLSVQPHTYLRTRYAANGEGKATDESKREFLDPTTSSCFVEIMAKVVARGFRALCGNLHADASLAQPGDFALLTALLQAILAVPGVAAVAAQLAEVVASSSLIRGALSLYSWADRLAEHTADQDPAYGEVAIKFLLALSTIRPVAEMLAVHGVLSQLSSANLSNYFRKAGGKGPFDEPGRMFTIWTAGFLPLCLNLLDAVGPPLAAEVATFLNSFPLQLARAATALENRDPSPRHPHAGAVTLGLVSEANSLLLLAAILHSDTVRGAADGINAADVPTLEFPAAKVREDVAGLMRQRVSLMARTRPVGEREVEWAGTAVPGPRDNLLQEKVLREVSACAGSSVDG